jgi:hypothetical protein
VLKKLDTESQLEGGDSAHCTPVTTDRRSTEATTTLSETVTCTGADEKEELIVWLMLQEPADTPLTVEPLTSATPELDELKPTSGVTSSPVSVVATTGAVW